MQNIVVFGASGLAKIIIDIIEKCGMCRIVGLIDAAQPIGAVAFGYPVIGRDADLSRLQQVHGIDGGIIAIGDNWRRWRVLSGIAEHTPTFGFMTAVHPSVQIARGVTIGRGTVAMAGAVINSDSHVGEFCLICTGATIDHDNRVDDFATLAPKAATGGNVHIGTQAVIGMGATIIHGMTVGEHTVIGAGATVVRDVQSYVVAYGSPAKVVRTRQAGDAYL